MIKDSDKIGKLSVEELGKLFPIEVVPYNPLWKQLYEKENLSILNILGKDIVFRIEHFGSTAVEGLSAKPIIDILVEIPPLNNELKEIVIQKMNAADYHFIWRTDDAVPYMHFVKGYTINGFSENVFHVHMGDKNHS